MIKHCDRPIFGRLAAMLLTKMAHIVGPLALDQAHTQITLHKHAVNFKRVHDFLFSHVNSWEST